MVYVCMSWYEYVLDTQNKKLIDEVFFSLLLCYWILPKNKLAIFLENFLLYVNGLAREGKGLDVVLVRLHDIITHAYYECI